MGQGYAAEPAVVLPCEDGSGAGSKISTAKRCLSSVQPPTHPPIQEPTSLPPPPLPQDVRHWLQLIGHGEEAEWIDLGTVRGYKRIVFCQSVRDDVDANLGQGEWARLLPAVCEGRLVPTEWLNKVCGVVFGGGGWDGVEL